MITIEQTPEGFSVDIDGQQQMLQTAEEVCDLVERALGVQEEPGETEEMPEDQAAFQQGFAGVRG